MGAYFGTRAKPRIITIVVKDGNHFDVHEGEKYTDRLCWEEMLGQVATLTHPSINTPRFAMETPEGHAARRASWRTPKPPAIIHAPRCAVNAAIGPRFCTCGAALLPSPRGAEHV